ncbi:MAG: RICIN domain-containing protein, partial [Phaeodactylibacter sp.]|nr:RICIN domain-containing protein [Phaeodactylibacter sp.]
IKVVADGRYLHHDGLGDKLLSTRYQPNDDYTRFYLEPESDGSYRIKVKATNTYLHENGLGDKLLSTRHQVNDDFTRFRLVR